MPILTIRVSAKTTPELTQNLTSTLIDLTNRLLGKKPDVTAVVVDYVDPRYWIIGGNTLEEQGKASFFLNIKITAGTNTKDEKARYIAEVYSRMGTLLGELHAASYIHVEEVPADGYGYGGQTQEFRYISAVTKTIA